VRPVDARHQISVSSDQCPAGTVHIPTPLPLLLSQCFLSTVEANIGTFFLLYLKIVMNYRHNIKVRTHRLISMGAVQNKICRSLP
jgi:hypothetical protein